MSQLLPGMRQLLWRSLTATGITQACAAGSHPATCCTAPLAAAAAAQHCRQYSRQYSQYSWRDPLGCNYQQQQQQQQQHVLPFQQQQQQQQQRAVSHWHARQQQQLPSTSSSSSSSRLLSSWSGLEDLQRHSTTILCVRKGAEVVIIGDGQATQNDFIVKPNVCKVRRIGPSAVGGFAGVAVDGLALLEKLEAKLEEHPGQLLRAAVELAKMWRQDKLLRELDASLIVADATTTLWLMGNGDVLEPGEDGLISIGSGADFAESAARALLQLQQEHELRHQQEVQQQPSGSSGQLDGVRGDEAAAGEGAPAPAAAAAAHVGGMSLFEIAKAAMRIAADCCVYTNANFSWHHIKPDGSIVSGSSANEAAAAAPAEVK